MSRDTKITIFIVVISTVSALFSGWWWYEAPCQTLIDVNSLIPGRCIATKEKELIKE